MKPIVQAEYLRWRSVGTSSELGPSENGQTLILFVLALGVLFGLMAMVIDVSLTFEERRTMQNAADAAALAGASALPPSGSAATAIARAREWAEKNGFSDGKNGVAVTITTPYQGDTSKIEVKITGTEPALFARVLGKTGFAVKARAVAAATAGSNANAAFLVLNETLCKSFNKTGSANLTINNNGGIMVNSACNPSINRTGGGSVSAAVINYYKLGGFRESGSGKLVPTPNAVGSRIPDPLASEPPPNLGVLGQSPDSGGTAAKPATKVLNSGTATLRPGVYYGGIEIRSTANVTFQPGTYVMAGGGLKLVGSGTITGTGVTFYNTYDPQMKSGAGACGEINLRGSAKFSFTGPTSGTYKDIVFWQDKACTNDFKMEGGQGGAAGVIYVPGALVNLSGSGNLGSIQVVSDSVDISGTGDMSVNFVPYLSIPLRAGIRLVE